MSASLSSPSAASSAPARAAATHRARPGSSASTAAPRTASIGSRSSPATLDVKAGSAGVAAGTRFTRAVDGQCPA